MKTNQKQIRPITILLAVIILFQGCTVYKSANVTLEEAVRADTKVRIKTKDNKTFKFYKVGFENNQYYGSTLFKDNFIKVGIDDTNINKVQVKDKTSSTILNIVAPIVIFLGIHLSGHESSCIGCL